MSEQVVSYAERTAAGGWRVTGSRVSLDSVVHAYWQGQSPEAVVAEFPSLSLEQVYGAIAFYLRHQDEINAYLDEQDAAWKRLKTTSCEQNRDLLERLRAARTSTPQQESSA